MPEWSIVISGPKGEVTLNPNPQVVLSGDLVFWSNRTDDPYSITIDDQPAVQPITAEPWESSKPSYKVATLTTQTSKDVPYTAKNTNDNSTVSGTITIKTALLLMLMFLGSVLAPSLEAQTTSPCAPIFGGELQNPPEITRDDTNKEVRGTVVTAGEKQVVVFLKTPPGRVTTGEIKPSDVTCVEQWMRSYRKDEPPANSQQPNAPATLPHSGPTVRARVGDLVQLTFLNLIDPLNFPGTDTGDCDQVTNDAGGIYPHTDKFPNCFHGSVFTNIHYHGTHTSPSTAADNVFLEIVPSPRAKNSARTPAVTLSDANAQLAPFFNDCKTELSPANVPLQWPKIWDDLPEAYRKAQFTLMCGTLSPEDCRKQNHLYDANQTAIENGQFPQNYVGAFPYCFRLPVYTSDVFPPPPPGHYDPKNPTLQMGQAPGTHWYHAHKHGSTTINVSNGMTGVLIVEGPYDDEIRAWYKARGPEIKEKVIVLNQIGGAPPREGGNTPSPGPYFSVNGRLQPFITMAPGEVQMWRIANTSSRSGAIFTVPAGLKWRQLAVDGVQLADARYVESQGQEFILASGNRVDLLVQAPPAATTSPIGVSIIQTIDPLTDRSAGKQQLLLNVKIGNTPVKMAFMDRSAATVKFPPYLTDIKDSEVDPTWYQTIRFATDRNTNPPTTPPLFTNHTIDGKKFSGEVGAMVMLNKVAEWKVTNASYNPKIAHPYHIHINPFQITEEFEPNAVLTPAAAGPGTVSTTKDTSIVTGTGFTKTFRVGDIITITGESAPAYVVSIQSDEQLTFSTAKAKGVTNAAYTVTVPLYSTNAAATDRHEGQCYINPADEKSWRPCAPTEPAEGRKWWDVFSIPSGNLFYSNPPPAAPTPNPTPIPGSFTLRSRFVDYPGYFVIHCHILSHEDRGMMTVVNVAPNVPPVTHH